MNAVFGSPTLLDERCRQLELNLAAISSTLVTTSNSKIDLNLRNLDAELRNAHLRANALGSSAVQRLEEKVALLDKYFDKCISLLDAPTAAATLTALDTNSSPICTQPSSPQEAQLTPSLPFSPTPTVLFTPPPPPDREIINSQSPPHDDKFIENSSHESTQEMLTAATRLGEAEAQLVSLQGELDDAIKRFTSLEKQLSEKTQLSKQNEEELLQATSALAASEAENVELRQKIARSRDDVKQVHSIEQYAILEKELEESREAERLASLQVKMQSMRAEENAREAAQLHAQLEQIRTKMSTSQISDEKAGSCIKSAAVSRNGYMEVLNAESGANYRSALGMMGRQLIHEQHLSSHLKAQLAAYLSKTQSYEKAESYRSRLQSSSTVTSVGEDDHEASKMQLPGMLTGGQANLSVGEKEQEDVSSLPSPNIHAQSVEGMRSLLGAAVRAQIAAHTKVSAQARNANVEKRPGNGPRVAAEADSDCEFARTGAGGFDPRARCTTFPDLGDLGEDYDSEENEEEVDEGQHDMEIEEDSESVSVIDRSNLLAAEQLPPEHVSLVSAYSDEQTSSLRNLLKIDANSPIERI